MRWSLRVDGFPDDQEDFELDSLLNGDPVPVVEYRGYVATEAILCDDTCIPFFFLLEPSQ